MRKHYAIYKSILRNGMKNHYLLMFCTSKTAALQYVEKRVTSKTVHTQTTFKHCGVICKNDHFATAIPKGMVYYDILTVIPNTELGIYF